MKILTQKEVRELFSAAFPWAEIKMGDSQYAVPTLKWLLGDFAKYFRSYLFARGIERYQKDSRDCDNFTALYTTEVQLAHSKTAGSGSALSVAELHYRQTTPYGLHVAVTAIAWDKGLVIANIEPQNQGRMILDEDEIRSAHLVDL